MGLTLLISRASSSRSSNPSSLLLLSRYRLRDSVARASSVE